MPDSFFFTRNEEGRSQHGERHQTLTKISIFLFETIVSYAIWLHLDADLIKVKLSESAELNCIAQKSGADPKNGTEKRRVSLFFSNDAYSCHESTILKTHAKGATKTLMT